MDSILQYIVGTTDHGSVFDSKERVVLYATVDASYGCHDDRKAHSACTLHIGKHSASILSRNKK